MSTAADGAAGRDAGITRLSKSQVFCRDLAGAYADGAATGAPQADQVADRWHLWHNLAEHVEKTVARHRECLTVPEGSPIEAAAPPPAANAAEGRLLQRARHRYEAVQALRSQGLSVMAITRELGLARGTVRRFARATSVEDVLAVGRDGRPSILDPFKQHLRQRWHDGVRSAAQLCTEIRALGCTGCYTTVRAYLQPFRTLTTVAPVLLGPPKVREVTAWMLRHPNNRTADEQIRLKQVLANSTDLAATARHISALGEMISGHNGDRLNNWISQIRTDDLPHLHSFAAGLQRDRTAVLNGLTLHYSSGPVEGTVNRIKMIKRQMYGRAKFDLPRKRILIGA